MPRVKKQMPILTDAQRKLAEENVGIAYKCANDCLPDIHRCIPWMDRSELRLELESAGLEGVMQAAAEHVPERGRFSVLAYVLAKRRMVDYMRRCRVREAVTGDVDTIDGLSLPHRGPRLENDVIGRELIVLAAAELTRTEGELLRLIASGYDYESAGERLGLSFKQVDGMISRARKKLRPWWRSEFGGRH